jgi:hypothetical protein
MREIMLFDDALQFPMVDAVAASQLRDQPAMAVLWVGRPQLLNPTQHRQVVSGLRRAEDAAGSQLQHASHHLL